MAETATETDAELGRMATDLVSRLDRGEAISLLDEGAKPLIERLVALGHIPSNSAFVEWQGAWEFEVVAVCHCEHPESPDYVETWVNVFPSGLVEAF